MAGTWHSAPHCPSHKAQEMSSRTQLVISTACLAAHLSWSLARQYNLNQMVVIVHLNHSPTMCRPTRLLIPSATPACPAGDLADWDSRQTCLQAASLMMFSHSSASAAWSWQHAGQLSKQLHLLSASLAHSCNHLLACGGALCGLCHNVILQEHAHGELSGQSSTSPSHISL
jgi:hypothetical protein